MSGSITTGLSQRARDNRPHFVYQFWDAQGRCLYVGMTAQPGGRISNHAATQPWWKKVDRFVADVHPDRETARLAEARLIEQHQPRYNFYLAEASAGSRSGTAHGGVNWRKDDLLGDD